MMMRRAFHFNSFNQKKIFFVYKLTKVRYLCTNKINQKAISVSSKSNSDKIFAFACFLFIVAEFSKVVDSFLTNYQTAKEVKKDIKELLRENIKDAKITVDTKKAESVARKELEAKVKKILTSPTTDHYTVIYGNKGAGKSHLVSHCAADLTSVIRVDVTSAHSKEDIVKLMLKKLNYSNLNLDLSEIKNQMNKVNIDYNIYPIIIFDIERGGSPGQELGLEAVRSISKFLARYCRCIIVLSEANAINTFGKDVTRESYIFVDELSIEEAKEYFKENKYDISEDQMKYIFDNIGTNPAHLYDIISSVPNPGLIKEYVDKVLTKADKDLTKFPLQTLLQALKDHPDGIDPRYFKKEEKGINLSDENAVGKIMKDKSNPIIYRMDTGKYHLLSTAHRTALKSYVPKIDRTWFEFLTGKGWIY